MEHYSGAFSHVYLFNKTAVKYTSTKYTLWLREYVVAYIIRLHNPYNLISYRECFLSHTPLYKGKIVEYYLISKMNKMQKTLNRAKYLNDRQVCQIIIDISNALAFLHQHNIWHRDVKSDNILLDKDNRAYLCDYSHCLSHYSDEIILDPDVVTYYNRPPEVFLYKDQIVDFYDYKIDIWSMGMVIYELLCGKSLDRIFRKKSFKNMLIEQDYMKELKKIYKEHCRYKYKIDYWNWLECLLCYDSKLRPEANTLKNLVLAFCSEHKIKVIDSSCSSTPLTVYPKEYILTKDQVNVLSHILPYAVEVMTVMDLLCDQEEILDLINYMIYKNYMTPKYYKEGVVSICTIYSAIYGDISFKTADVIKNTEISEKKFYEEIHQLLRDMSSVLFSHGGFRFSS